jgi:phosphoribosylglycinamide formyltransferase-1
MTPTASTLRICAAISGRATVLRAVIEAGAEGLLPIEFCGFVADRPCSGLELAAEYGIPSQSLEFASFSSRRAFDETFDAVVLGFRPDLVLLHYNRLVSPHLLSALPGRVINTHYSLLPAFPGFKAITRALHSGVHFAGVTIHVVTERIDDGPILAQAVCPILSDDTDSSLGFRLFAASVPLTLGLLATAPDFKTILHTKLVLPDKSEANLSVRVPAALETFAAKFVAREMKRQASSSCA